MDTNTKLTPSLSAGEWQQHIMLLQAAVGLAVGGLQKALDYAAQEIVEKEAQEQRQAEAAQAQRVADAQTLAAQENPPPTED